MNEQQNAKCEQLLSCANQTDVMIEKVEQQLVLLRQLKRTLLYERELLAVGVSKDDVCYQIPARRRLSNVQLYIKKNTSRFHRWRLPERRARTVFHPAHLTPNRSESLR